jgi:GNAT superfamily N-acetyltransferase
VQHNWLSFPTSHLDPVEIPFGLGIGTRRRQPPSNRLRTYRPKLRVRAAGRRILSVEVKADHSWRVVLPTFSRIVMLATKPRKTLCLEVATKQSQRAIAHDIVRRVHYLRPRPGGLVLLAYIEREIVGALILERMMHGHPNGRDEIYRRERKRVPTGSVMSRPGFRVRAVNELGLYWISRVAVRARHRGLGVGSILSDAAREIARFWMPHKGKYVELIRLMPRTHFDNIVAGESDFLTGLSRRFGLRLPFFLRNPPLSQKPGGRCLAYYFAPAGNMRIPVTRLKNRASRGPP